MNVHQFHPTVSFGDGISNQIMSLQKLLRQLGHQSEIFCQHQPLQFEGKVREISRYPRYSSPDTLMILHYSLGYPRDVQAWLKQIPDRKIICYHNITPHHFFSGINETFYDAALQGRKELPRLRQLTEAGWGDSSFNVQELKENGWKQVDVFPIIFEPDRHTVSPDRKILNRYRDKPNILYVSRVSPNKKVEDVILTFYHLKQVRPETQLVLVGSAGGMDLYQEYLQTLVNRLELDDVIFTGHVSAAELAAYYQTAKILISMSEHEGFGIPFLEAMCFKVPVVAYKAGAVDETLGDSGLLVTKKEYPAIAELLNLLLDDQTLRNKLIARQQKRLQDYLPKQLKPRLQKLLLGLGIT